MTNGRLETELSVFAGKKAGGVMLRGNGRQFRFLAAADRFGIKAAGVETASGRGVDGGGDVARQYNASFFVRGVRYGCGREQGLGIRVHGGVVKGGCIGDLDQFAQVHHRHAVTDVLDDIQIVGDELIGQSEGCTLGVMAQDVGAFEENLAAGGFLQVQDQSAQGRFAVPGLT